jgi:ubiquinone/menaquinone biosynthesis C-methylase UbiE
MSNTYEKKDAAERYNASRTLPDATMKLWMDKLSEKVPVESVTRVLDLGGGTGRFTVSIRKTYHCPVVVIEPSKPMLEQGKSLDAEDVFWLCGNAEYIPLADGSVNMVWMSQVFHHLGKPALAFQEIRRVLPLGGYFVVRNGTRESDAGQEWMRYFPEAQQLNQVKTPSQSDIVDSISRHGFDIIDVETVNQIFAASFIEYYQKISQRGLSSLISISDKAFNRGIGEVRAWAESKPQDQPVYDPVDMFIFQKRG